MVNVTNQEKTIRTLGEKGNRKYVGILEVDTINRIDRKNKKKVLQKNIKYFRNQFWCRNIIIGINTWRVTLKKILRTILKVTKEGTYKNGLKYKGSDGYAQGFTPKRWYWLSGWLVGWLIYFFLLWINPFLGHLT